MTRSRSFAARIEACRPFRPDPFGPDPRSSGPEAAIRSALLLLGTAFALLAPFAATAGPRLLLLPVVVHSAEDPEYLRDGLSDMLASRFERIGSIDLVRGEVDGRGTTDGDKARSLAEEAGADYVLYGSFTRFGQGASLDVQCAPLAEDGDREPLREIFVHSGSIGEIIPDLDELAGKVSRFVRGERVVSGVPDAAGGGIAGASAGEVGELRQRIEALEAAIRALADES